MHLLIHGRPEWTEMLHCPNQHITPGSSNEKGAWKETESTMVILENFHCSRCTHLIASHLLTLLNSQHHLTCLLFKAL